jgi:hypothetical protein
MDRVGKLSLVACRFVCREWNLNVIKDFACKDFGKDFISEAAETGSVNLLWWAFQQGAPWGEQSTIRAARCGRLDVFIWFLNVSARSLTDPHPIFKKFIDVPLPLDKIYPAAVLSRNIDLINWLSHLVPIPPPKFWYCVGKIGNFELMAQLSLRHAGAVDYLSLALGASKKNHTNILCAVINIPESLDEQTTYRLITNLAKWGNITLLEFIKRSMESFGEKCAQATVHGACIVDNPEVLEWLSISSGARINFSCALECGSIHVLNWLWEHGMRQFHFTKTISNIHISSTAWESAICGIIRLGNDTRVLDWLLENEITFKKDPYECVVDCRTHAVLSLKIREVNESEHCSLQMEVVQWLHDRRFISDKYRWLTGNKFSAVLWEKMLPYDLDVRLCVQYAPNALLLFSEVVQHCTDGNWILNREPWGEYCEIAALRKDYMMVLWFAQNHTPISQKVWENLISLNSDDGSILPEILRRLQTLSGPPKWTDGFINRIMSCQLRFNQLEIFQWVLSRGIWLTPVPGESVLGNVVGRDKRNIEIMQKTEKREKTEKRMEKRMEKRAKTKKHHVI